MMNELRSSAAVDAIPTTPAVRDNQVYAVPMQSS